MAEFEKIKVHFDEQAYESQLSDFEGRKELFQNVINDIKNVINNIVFAPNDLTKIFANPKGYFVDKIVTEPMTVGGVELDKNKVFDLLECSDDLKAIITNITRLNGNVSHVVNERGLYAHAKHYLINDNSEIEINPDFIEYLKNNHSVYVVNERQKQIFDCLNKFVNTYGEFSDLFPNMRLEKVVEVFLSVNGNMGTVKINYKEMQRHQ